jgi:hypothetical protein
MEQMYFKFPRTYHFEWSLGSTSDDKFHHDMTSFENYLGTGSPMMTITTLKMDGENTSLYPDRMHARSIDSKYHDSRNWVKGLWGQIRHDIPEGWRICGENLYAKHSLLYEELPTYFMVFSVWNDKNRCLSWVDTLDICEMLGLQTVPLLQVGPYNEAELRKLADSIDTTKNEGYVTRNIGEFGYDEYDLNVGKFVRAKHVTTDQHWMHSAITPNKLKP